MPRPAHAHRKTVKIPMPLGKNAHRVRAQVASLGSTHSRGQRRLGGRQGGVLNVSPAPHLDALDVPSYPTALTRRLHAPAPQPESWSRTGNTLMSTVRRCARIPSDRRRAPCSTVIQPGGQPVSRAVSQFTHLFAGRLKPSSQKPRQGVRGQDR